MYKRAKHIVQKLTDNGYIAYYAGGWVRDFILKKDSDDIDIATNAPPEIIEKLFDHTVPIGAAFGIILVIIDSHQYEVATFRKDIEYSDGRRPSSIEYTTAFEDAKRRDFTINGMFYDPLKEEIIDFVEGQKDLQKKIIRAIGIPEERMKEDRLRILRAVRIAARFSFQIEAKTEEAIKAYAHDLFPSVAVERIWQEITKMDKYASFTSSIKTLFKYKILQTIFPYLEDKDTKFIDDSLLYVSSFPKEAPTVIKILELFPNFSLDEKIEVCKYLKLSNEDISFVASYHKLLDIAHSEEISNNIWAHSLSIKNEHIIFEIIAAHFSLLKKTDFLEMVQTKRNELKLAIDRIKTNSPLVSASSLIAHSILPGRNMGQILKMAEELSINNNIDDADQVIKLLKNTSIWPKE